jgi:transcriptional antiterminator RfaH
MPYWCAAQLDAGRVNYAPHCLNELNYEVYAPRLRTHCVVQGRKVEERPLLFPSYVFIAIVAQWHAARWACGVVRLVMAGAAPARVADSIINEIKGRERNGAIELVARPRFKPGDPIRVVSGPFVGLAGLYQGMNGHQRVAVLLSLLGGPNRTELPANAIEPIEASR